jgi:hypothetical protein
VLTADEQKRLMDHIREKIRSLPGYVSVEKIPTPSRVVPPLGGFDIGRDGRIWVSVVGDIGPATVPPSQTLNVIDPTGVFIGQVRGIPTSAHIRSILGDDVWCIEYDIDGLETVTRYHVTWGQ